MYALMQRCRALGQRMRPAQPRLEAIFAATLLHLEPGDFCSPLPGSPTSAALAAERLADPVALPHTHRITLTTGVALACKLSSEKRVALAYSPTGPATARTEQGWPAALSYAAEAHLPLILVCAAPPAPVRKLTPQALTLPALTLPALTRLARPLKLPVLTVDGTDAVAVYRVMQESTHRARLGDGPAVLWCLLPPLAARTPAKDPLRKLQQYLRVRNLLPKTSPRTVSH